MRSRLLLGATLLALCLLVSPAAAFAAPAARSSDGADVFPSSLARRSAATVLPSSLTTAPTVVEVAGANRIDTAVAASKRAFPGHADTIVLCTGWNWPDALGGAALAGASDGPLLLTRPDALSSAVVTETVRLDAHNAVLIGSENAVSAEVEDALKALDVNGHGLTVTRVGGARRFETSAMVASATVDALRSHGRTYDGTAFFSTGRNFPDALAASPISAKKGWPVLLVEPSGLTSPTEDAIGRLGVTRGILLGSDKAVTKVVADRLASVLPSPPQRLEGADRYLTAIQIARFGVSNGLSWDGVGVTTGENFPDALAGGVMQARLGSVVLLTQPAYLTYSVFTELTSVRAGVHSVRYFGNTGAVKQYTRDGVMAALTGKPYPTRNGMTFPVDGPASYENDFGAPRSGGRTHEGIDILAPRDTPVGATLNGIVTARTNTLGGNVIYLDADNGWRFYYAHLDHWEVKSGHVQAGQRIGYVGNTGNAAGGPTHLHFQMWKPDGTLVNPYSYLNDMVR
jgi:murein DD-endopeptidase MepM/ murein hydrolase activator NlpD